MNFLNSLLTFIQKNPKSIGILFPAAFIAAILGFSRYLDDIRVQVAANVSDIKHVTHQVISNTNSTTAFQKTINENVKTEEWNAQLARWNQNWDNEQNQNSQMQQALGELKGRLIDIETLVYQLNASQLKLKVIPSQPSFKLGDPP